MPIKVEIDIMERDINTMAYKLYGIADDEIKIVEEATYFRTAHALTPLLLKMKIHKFMSNSSLALVYLLF